MGIVVLICLILVSGPASADVLYDIGFESPPHTVGSMPVIGLGPPPRSIPSTIWVGEPTVVASMAGLAQCLRFDSFCCPWGQDEIILFFSGEIPDFPYYRVGFTTTIEGIETGARFVARFETPIVHNIAFTWDNSLGGIVSAGRLGQEIPIGTWEPETPIRVAVDATLGGEWKIYLDGTEVLAATWDSWDLRLLWFVTEFGGVAAGLDNIFVWGGSGPVKVQRETWSAIKALYR